MAVLGLTKILAKDPHTCRLLWREATPSSESSIGMAASGGGGGSGVCVAALLTDMLQPAARYAHVTQPVCDREMEDQRNAAAMVAAAVAAGAPPPPQPSAKGAPHRWIPWAYPWASLIRTIPPILPLNRPVIIIPPSFPRPPRSVGTTARDSQRDARGSQACRLDEGVG